MFSFTRNEIRDLIIAFIVISVAFTISNVGLDAYGVLSILPIIMVGVGIGFLLHELDTNMWQWNMATGLNLKHGL